MRAEDFRLAAADAQGFALRVDYIEELGSQRLIHGMIGDQSLTVAFPADVEVPSALSVTIAPEKLHFFASETGKRIASRAEQTVLQDAQLATA
ncbi:UNVERIFIED_ORG: ABC-type sugar transport system ATPase subunit [Rhizobium sp. SORGH_AS260]|nr:ABC-type sugar transport system ATPase subunit [Rhizobium sp. SORGH_AS_0260]